jgi:SprT-like family
MDLPINRETWLQKAVLALEPIFSAVGYGIPPLKVSCGFAASSSPRTTLGQCWPRQRSREMVNEIFISPKIDDPVEVLDTLVHEICHAIDDCQSGHGADFQGIAQVVGLEGPARMAMAGPALKIRLMTISQKLGEYPHRALEFPPPRPSNATRSKAKCPECGYEVSLLKKWADYGPPICPKDKVRMAEYTNEIAEPNTEKQDDQQTEIIHRAVS